MSIAGYDPRLKAGRKPLLLDGTNEERTSSEAKSLAPWRTVGLSQSEVLVNLFKVSAVSHLRKYTGSRLHRDVIRKWGEASIRSDSHSMDIKKEAGLSEV